MWDGRGAAHGRHRSLQGLPQSIDQFRGLGDIRRVQKEIRRGGVFPLRQRLQPDGEHRLILLHVIAAYKPDHWVLRGHDGVDRHFRFFTLSLNDGFAMGDRAVHRPAIEDHPVNGTLKQAAIERFLCVALRKKVRLPDFNAVGEFAGQGIQELPERR